jgi:hypothetical protein
MRKALRGGLLGLVSLILANCAGGEPQGRLAHSDQSELLAMLQLGRQVLDCREACLDAWKHAQPNAAQLDAAAKWDDLAVLVMRNGYEDDLSLYYLGRAAEGRGFSTAAAGYYRRSVELSATAISCKNLSHLCGGVALPSSASERLAAAEQMLIPRRTRARQPATSPHPAAAEPVVTEDPASAVQPPRTALPAPAISPAQPAATANPDAAAAATAAAAAGAAEYIEPPPASR